MTAAVNAKSRVPRIPDPPLVTDTLNTRAMANGCAIGFTLSW
jgi:hypothetical protein